NLQSRLDRESTPAQIAETEKRVEEDLRNWGEQASRYYRDKTNDVKELLLTMAKAAGENGDRDEQYARRFNGLAEKLQTASTLADLAAVRHSLSASASELRSTVTRMTQDSQAAIANLRAQIATYEIRLAEVEHVACLDPLTGIANRRRLENSLQ